MKMLPLGFVLLHLVGVSVFTWMLPFNFVVFQHIDIGWRNSWTFVFQLLVVGIFLLLSIVILHKRKEAGRVAAREQDEANLRLRREAEREQEEAKLRLEHELQEDGRDAMVPRIVNAVVAVVKALAFGFGHASWSKI